MMMMAMPHAKAMGHRINLKQSFNLNENRSIFPVPDLSDLRILVLDNYDSFTYNLVQYLAEISAAEVRVFRNDQISVRGVREEQPTHIVVSPGPCTPDEAGISMDAVADMAGECPILGVCLGHQSIGQVYGGRIVRGRAPVHGKTSMIHHDGRTIFSGLPDPFVATRYHSLVVDPDLPSALELSAWTSSMPSWPRTTRARSQPLQASAPARASRCSAELTPTSCLPAPAGFVSGPRKLNTVRTPRARRMGAILPAAGW